MNTSTKTPRFTVCTTTFNRAHLLPKLYQSLVNQTIRDFEWLVIDDGSTDDTRSLIEGWIKQSPFAIRYFWKPNGGNYSAMNVGVSNAKGELFASIDSDDCYVPDALERFYGHWESIPLDKRCQFVGVCGLDAYESGEIVGTKFPFDSIDSDDIEIRFKYRVKGDKISVMKTEVMKGFPFPEDCGRYVTPSVVWNRIGLRYKTRFVNEVFAVIEYQEDGLTANDRFNYFRNPGSVSLCLRELINSGRRFPVDVTIKTHANYVRYSMHQGASLGDQRKQICSGFLFWLFVPLGSFLYWRDRRLIRSHQAVA